MFNSNPTNTPEITAQGLASDIMRQRDPAVLRQLAKAMENASRRPPTKRAGFLMALIGSTHLRSVKTPKGRVSLYLEVRDRDLYPDVPTSIVCMHPGCADKSWPDEAAVVADHAPHAEMVKQGTAHVVALYSEAHTKPEDPTSPVIGLMSTEKPEPRS